MQHHGRAAGVIMVPMTTTQRTYANGLVGTDAFLPTTRREMRRRGWEQVDFVYVCGDASVDHPSFGCAITPRAYVGAGIGIHSFNAIVDSYPQRTDKAQPEPNDPNWRYPFIPIYAEGRYSFNNESHNTPWASLKVGATFINHKGFYTSPSLGYHFKSNQFFSFNVGVGYALHTAHYKLWCTGDTPGAIPDNSGSSYLDKNAMFHNFFIKAGVEF